VRVPFGAVLPSLDDSAFCELVFTDSDVKGLVSEAMLRRGDDWRKYVPNYFLATGKAELRAARVEGPTIGGLTFDELSSVALAMVKDCLNLRTVGCVLGTSCGTRS